MLNALQRIRDHTPALTWRNVRRPKAPSLPQVQAPQDSASLMLNPLRKLRAQRPRELGLLQSQASQGAASTMLTPLRRIRDHKPEELRLPQVQAARDTASTTLVVLLQHHAEKPEAPLLEARRVFWARRSRLGTHGTRSQLSHNHGLRIGKPIEVSLR